MSEKLVIEKGDKLWNLNIKLLSKSQSSQDILINKINMLIDENIDNKNEIKVRENSSSLETRLKKIIEIRTSKEEDESQVTHRSIAESIQFNMISLYSACAVYGSLSDVSKKVLKKTTGSGCLNSEIVSALGSQQRVNSVLGGIKSSVLKRFDKTRYAKRGLLRVIDTFQEDVGRIHQLYSYKDTWELAFKIYDAGWSPDKGDAFIRMAATKENSQTQIIIISAAGVQNAIDGKCSVKNLDYKLKNNGTLKGKKKIVGNEGTEIKPDLTLITDGIQDDYLVHPIMSLFRLRKNVSDADDYVTASEEFKKFSIKQCELLFGEQAVLYAKFKRDLERSIKIKDIAYEDENLTSDKAEELSTKIAQLKGRIKRLQWVKLNT